jgi:thymidylate synthase
MNGPYFTAATLDDVMRLVVEDITNHGEQINPSKGPATELVGVLLEVTDPRARLSRTETRGKLFSSLGELCWYLAKSNDLPFISYYVPEYKQFADGDRIFGGYGPRAFNWGGLNQMANVTEILRNKRDSRQAVIQLFDRHDIVRDYEDVPCTCTLQFMRRGDKLHMFTNMRSNDIFLGLPHDIFCFTMLHEIMARTLSVELGTYRHAVGSLHLYDKNLDGALQFLGEGWQATDAPMPPMPKCDPWAALNLLLQVESALRNDASFDEGILEGMDPYWLDLVRLLQVFRLKKNKDRAKIQDLRGRMDSKIYLPFIDKILGELP